MFHNECILTVIIIPQIILVSYFIVNFFNIIDYLFSILYIYLSLMRLGRQTDRQIDKNRSTLIY